MILGFALDPTTNDLYLESSGDLAVVEDAHAVGQHVRQRLKTFRGEWFLDTTAGVPWLDQILGKAYDPALAEAVVKAEILNTHSVVEITTFSVAFERGVRRLEIKDIEVLTTFDQEVAI